MNTKDVSYLLQHPDKLVSPLQIKQLEEVLEEYPYFQAARSLHLKGLKNLNSFKYNNALKVVAAYTADREVLFDFITSKDFIQNTIADNLLGNTTGLVDNAIKSEEIVTQKLEEIEVDTTEKNLFPLTRAEADTLLDPQLFKVKDSNQSEPTSDANQTASDQLDIGEPLPFTKKERYSFGEWLQLTAFKPLKEKKNASTEKELEDINFPIDEENSLEENSDKQKKIELIDKFIADRPKIKPQKDVPKIAISTSVKFDKKELMTETLAKVYLEQKKYKNAIQAYKILSLKYPEKSGFFADRIKAVERLKAEDN